MSKSTKDCKEFIESISKVIGGSSSDQWKRTKKYKQDALILRDFENQNGRTLTICEANGELSLFQVTVPSVSTATTPDKNVFGGTFISGWGDKRLGRKATNKDIAQFLSECVTDDPNLVEHYALKTAKKAASWEPIEDNGYSVKDWIEEWDGSEQCYLYYAGENGETLYVDEQKVAKVHVFFMPDCDTAYRISVYETKDHCLYLGNNNPD